jgi:RHS repeat-associated protein
MAVVRRLRANKGEHQMRGSDVSASTGSHSRVFTSRRRVGSKMRLKRGLALVGVLVLSLIASACSRTHTHDSDSQTVYDATFATTGDSYTIGTRPDHMAEVGAYSGDKLATASYDGQDQNGAGSSEARGTFTAQTNPDYEGYYGAAFYFKPGTLSGTTQTPAKQKGRVDIMRWDNAPTYGAANKDIGGIRVNADHTANLFWDGPTTAEATIGSGFRLREGCWNWLFVKQKQGDAGAAKNEVYLNGEKLFSSSAKNITTGRIVDRMHWGLPGISSAQAGSSLDVYVDDAHVGATNSTVVEPRTKACEPQTGARPYYKIEDQQLSDRMGMGVNVASGNLIVSEADLAIAGTQLDLTLSRTYNSARLESSKMGVGWNLSGGSDVSVRYDGDGDAIYRGATGEKVTFKKNGSSHDSPTGFRDLKLTKNGDGTSKLEFLKDRTKLNFHSDGGPYLGALSSVVDKNDNTITFNYNSTSGVLQSVTDTQGRTVSVTTDSSGRVTQLRDFDTPTARTWTYTIGADGELDVYENPEGDDTLYDYGGPNDRLTQITDGNLNQTRIEYESAYPHRVKRILRAPGTADEAIWRFDYTTDAAVCDNDENGNPRGKTVVTDPNNHPTTYCWDPLGRVHKVRDAKNRNRSTEYDADSNVKKFTNGTAVSNATYGPEGKLTSVLSPTGAQTSFSYNDDGDQFPDTITTQSQQGGQFVKSLTYANNNLKRAADKTGTTETSPTDFDYNQKGQLTSVIPPRGENQGNPGSNPYETRYEYSAPSGGNLTKIDRPAPLGDETFTYDALSRVKTRTDGQGRVQTYEYDKMDFVQRIGYKNSATGPEVSSLQFDYDDNGNLICRGENGNCEDPGAVETDYQYDRLNRLKLEDFPSSGVEGDALYTYDRVGNLKTFRESASPSQTITYTYDEVNNLIEMRDSDNLPTTFGPYDERNNRERTIFPNGVQVDQTFDNSDRIKTIKAKKQSSSSYYVNLQYFYKYPPQGVSWPSECGAQPGTETGQLRCVKDLVAGTTIKYSYSPNTDRLTEADMTGGSNPTDYRYTYDGNSNRTRQEVIAPGGTTTTHYRYGNADQLCWAFTSDVGSCTPSPTGSTAYSFDASGNQTGFTGGCQLSYNTRNQNTSVTGCGGANANSVQYLGPSNVERVVSDDVKFINSALGLVKRDNPNDPGNPVYFRRDDEGRLVQGFRSTASGAFRKYYYVHDQLGSVIALTDANGDLMRTYSYDPYGNVTDMDRSAGQNAPTDRFRFVAGYQGSGFLYHFGFRFYDPRIARFTQLDPIEQPGQSPYMYVLGDPINNTDPTGELLPAIGAAIAGSTVARVGVTVGARLLAGTSAGRSVGYAATRWTATSSRGASLFGKRGFVGQTTTGAWNTGRYARVGMSYHSGTWRFSARFGTRGRHYDLWP